MSFKARRLLHHFTRSPVLSVHCLRDSCFKQGGQPPVFIINRAAVMPAKQHKSRPDPPLVAGASFAVERQRQLFTCNVTGSRWKLAI